MESIFDSSTLFSINQSLRSTTIDDDITVTDSATGNYFTFSGTAAFVWNQLQQPVSIASICESACLTYDISPQECEQHVSTFLNQLVDQGLVKTH